MASKEKFYRLVDVLVYAIGLIAIQHFFIEGGLSFTPKSYWLFSGMVSLVLGSRLASPHYTSPRDACINSTLAAIAVWALLPSLAADYQHFLSPLVTALFVFFMVSALAAYTLHFWQSSVADGNVQLILARKLVQKMGSPKLVFSILTILFIYLFHLDDGVEVAVIIGALLLVSNADFSIIVAKVFETIRSAKRQSEQANKIVGVIERYHEPDLVTVRQKTKKKYLIGHLFLLNRPNEGWALGRCLGRAGRDDDYLLRMRVEPLPARYEVHTKDLKVALGEPFIMEFTEGEAEVEGSSVLGKILQNTDLEHVRFELLNDEGVSEGQLVSAQIGSESVTYQITGGVVKEEAVTQKNTNGFVEVTARKIGKWEDEKFKPVKWLPGPNSQVARFAGLEIEKKPESVGHFPDTSFGVSVDVNELVTHNTAILGILGIGKTYLACELIERMITQEIHVVCLDLTDQHKELLKNYFDQSFHDNLRNKLKEAAANERDLPKKSKTKGGSYPHFQEAVKNQLEEFLEKNDKHLLILNPADFAVTFQDRGEYNGEAGFADLTPSQITAIISTELLNVCQGKGITDKARVCLVYEEAHSLVPEWNSAGSDFDRTASNRSARAILQGRKYGLGCLLITQRTANVTKTILNQCNTIFAMRTFDDTGKEFLSNYIGREYTNTLPSLQERHAVVYGKASSCDNPVMIRLNDRDDFLKLNPPPPPSTQKNETDDKCDQNSSSDGEPNEQNDE